MQVIKELNHEFKEAYHYFRAIRTGAMTTVRDRRQLNIKTLSATSVSLKMKWKPPPEEVSRGRGRGSNCGRDRGQNVAAWRHGSNSSSSNTKQQQQLQHPTAAATSLNCRSLRLFAVFVFASKPFVHYHKMGYHK